MRMQRGFTLIELLVVIGILGLLAAAFLPDLIGGRDTANITETGMRQQFLVNGINAYRAANGNVPPDDLRDPLGKLTVKPDNGTNMGIESLVFFLSQKGSAGIDLSEHEGWLENTDADDHGTTMQRLGRTTRVEVVDAWGTPMAYFSSVSQVAGFDKVQKVMLPGEAGAGEVVDAKAWKRADGGFLGAGKYQIVSAGKDRVFNTDDDVTWPERF